MDTTYEEKMSKARRIQSQALAILRRAKDAGIPDEYMRINEKSFSEILFPDFYIKAGSNPENIARILYNNEQKLFSRRFIAIDGGITGENRRKAGFAILFRMIACDKNGKFEIASHMAHTLSTMWVSGDTDRNEYVDLMKEFDVLFISDFDKDLFKPNSDGGSYMDDILEHRFMYSLPTIISFSSPIYTRDGGNDGTFNDNRCGRYLYQILHSDVPGSKSRDELKILRIRVRS